MVAYDWHKRHSEKTSLGDKVADVITSFIGSWHFIIIQSIIMAIWVIYNVTALYRLLHLGQFDPYPFVFLNLFMSAEAAYATPLILMSQNRADARDREHAEHDFVVNKRTLAILLLIAAFHGIELVEEEIIQNMDEL